MSIENLLGNKLNIGKMSFKISPKFVSARGIVSEEIMTNRENSYSSTRMEASGYTASRKYDWTVVGIKKKEYVLLFMDSRYEEAYSALRAWLVFDDLSEALTYATTVSDEEIIEISMQER